MDSLYSDEHFEDGIVEYNSNVSFKFDAIKFHEELIGPDIDSNGNLKNRTTFHKLPEMGKSHSFAKDKVGVPIREKL